MNMGELEMMTPDPARAAWFNEGEEVWVLSRYRDVTAALRESRLWAVGGGKREIQTEARDHAGRLLLRPDLLEELSTARIAEWQGEIDRITSEAVRTLPAGRRVELLGEFAKPWGLPIAMMVTRADPAARERLRELGDRVFAATGAAEDSPLREPAAAATKELVAFFEKGPLPMGEPTFVALSQTNARLLTNAWLALFQRPEQCDQLRVRPELMPQAMEEMLRFAGIVRRIYRRATDDVEIGGVTIRKGQKVALMLASANRDPEEFVRPEVFDIARRFGGHTALGIGRNSCVGAPLIRATGSAATLALLRRFDRIEVHEAGDWRVGSGFCFPGSVYVTFHSAKT